MQPPAGVQISHGSQTTVVVPPQTPPVHWSPLVHAFVSSHEVPSGWWLSGGQAGLAPVHVSATSHWLAADRQTVPAGSRQLSAASLHVCAQAGPPAHGSPEWVLHPPPLQWSLPLQKRPSSHGAVLFVCTQAPPPLQ